MGLDIGTSGTKAILMDECGEILKTTRRLYEPTMPRVGWSEQDPNVWAQAASEIMLEWAEEPIDAIGLSGQMHGAVVLDEDFEPIRPAMLWNDQRTDQECADMEQAIGSQRLRDITRNPPMASFQVTKLLWMRKHEPENFARIRSVLLPKDWVRYCLCGVTATEVSDASGTGVFDVANRTWSTAILDHLMLDAGWFPRVYESAEVTGYTKTRGIPVVGGGGDQAAGAIGCGITEPGSFSLSLGTSGVLFTATEKPLCASEHGANIFCHANLGWHAMGVMLSCGGCFQWLRRTLFPQLGYGDLEALAASAPDQCDGLRFVPYLTGERCPVLDPSARGAWTALSASHTAAHLVRSVYEGVTLGIWDMLESLKDQGVQPGELAVTGGGAQSELWLQMIADATNQTLRPLIIDEGPAFGAAILAGVGIGVWPNCSTATHAVVQKKAPVFPQHRWDSQQLKDHRKRYEILRP